LNIAILRNSRDTGSQAAGKTGQYQLDRGGAVVFRGEYFRVVGIERERALVLLLFAEAEESIDRGPAVGSVYPFNGCAPFTPSSASTFTPLSTGFSVAAVLMSRSLSC
jgi:hypothetical protein